LLFDAKAHFSQFECETGFVCRLPKTRSQSSMDSNGNSNDLFRQLVGSNLLDGFLGAIAATLLDA
jgi:hypothetical protein